jgi:glutamate racemase
LHFGPIGVFDSGVGGISVLRAMRKMMPGERFIYYGDNLNAPYGTRPEHEIRLLTFASVQELLDRNVKALVIACNTATSAAAEALRERLTLPIIGMEPALKPAALSHENGKILVMATPATLRQRKFQELMRAYGDRAEMLPCPGLMEFAERGDIDSPALDKYLLDRFAPYEGEDVDAIVLGCTHYVFARRAIGKAMPRAQLYDGNEGTARRLMDILRAQGLEGPDEGGSVEFLTSGDPDTFLPIFQMLYDLPPDD